MKNIINILKNNTFLKLAVIGMLFYASSSFSMHMSPEQRQFLKKQQNLKILQKQGKIIIKDYSPTASDFDLPKQKPVPMKNIKIKQNFSQDSRNLNIYVNQQNQKLLELQQQAEIIEQQINTIKNKRQQKSWLVWFTEIFTGEELEYLKQLNKLEQQYIPLVEQADSVIKENKKIEGLLKSQKNQGQ